MKTNRNICALIVVIAGILTSVLIQLTPVWWLLLCLCSVCVGIILLNYNRGKINWVILIFLFGFSGFLFSQLHYQYQNYLKFNQFFTNKIVTVEGVQVERFDKTRYGIKFVLLVNPKHRHGPFGRITVFWRKPIPIKWYGHKLRITGKFKIKPIGNSIIPELSENRGLTGTISVTEKPVLLMGKGLPLPYIWANQLREAMINRGRQYLNPVNARLLHGMIFNDRLSIDITDRQLIKGLQRTGTIHLISVSGLHIGFLVISLTFLFGLLRIPKIWRILPLSLAISFYILMTGMNPPVLRAGSMMLLYIVSEVLGAGDDHLNRLSLAALILLLKNPYNLFELSFQLSFTATLGVVWLYPLLKEYFPVQHLISRIIWYGILVSLSAQILLIPLCAYYFQQISWVSPIINLLIFIPAEFVVIGGLAGEGLAILFSGLGRLLLIPVDWGLILIREMVCFFGFQSWAVSWTPSWSWLWITAYYLILLLGLDYLRPNLITQKRHIRYQYVFLGCLVFTNLIIWAGFFQQSREKYLEVSFIDVGQGDAIWLRTPDGFNTLIDGGDEGKGSFRVVPYLQKNGVEKLNMVLVTHGHKDHTAGLAEVLEEIPAGTLYLPVYNVNADMRNFLRKIKEVRIIRKTGFSGQIFRLGNGAQGEILQNTDVDSENDRSLLLLVSYGKNKLLLTGDLGVESEEMITRKYPRLLQASLLKIGHHGSNYATSLRFITQVKPKVAVISVGAGNKFGHPGKQILNRLRSLGVAVYRTDQQGTVRVRVYSDRLSVSTEK